MKRITKLAVAISAGFAAMAGATSAAELAPDAMLAEQWTLFEDYCMECHSFDEFRGGLALEGMHPDDVPGNPDVFESVLRKLKIRAMPPRDQPQPSQHDRAQLIAA